MIRTTLMAAAFLGATALGAATTATAHQNGYKHAHDGYGKHGKVNKRNKYKRYDNYVAPKKNWRRESEYKRRHKRDGYFGPYFDRAGFPPYVIRQTLRARGFRKIKFRDRQLPLYVAKACKRGKRFLIGLNRWGKIVWKEPRGYCGPRRHYY